MNLIQNSPAYELMSHKKKDKITGKILKGRWEASNGKFSVDFNSFDIDGSYKYKSKVKNGKIKARIYDDGDQIGHFKADYDVVRSFSGGESGRIFLNKESGGIRLFEGGDLFAFGYIPEVSDYL